MQGKEMGSLTCQVCSLLSASEHVWGTLRKHLCAAHLECQRRYWLLPHNPGRTFHFQFTKNKIKLELVTFKGKETDSNHADTSMAPSSIESFLGTAVREVSHPMPVTYNCCVGTANFLSPDTGGMKSPDCSQTSQLMVVKLWWLHLHSPPPNMQCTITSTQIP